MELTNQYVQSIFEKFDVSETFKGFVELTSGHINTTLFIETTGTNNYVLQRINDVVFKNPKQLILNKILVSEHIQNQLQGTSPDVQQSKVLKFVKTHNELPFHIDNLGKYWNLSLFIKESHVYERVTTNEIAFEGGILFGEFLNLTENLEADKIVPIIPNFHNMSFRFEQFYESLENARKKRLHSPTGGAVSPSKRVASFRDGRPFRSGLPHPKSHHRSADGSLCAHPA